MVLIGKLMMQRPIRNCFILQYLFSGRRTTKLFYVLHSAQVLHAYCPCWHTSTITPGNRETVSARGVVVVDTHRQLGFGRHRCCHLSARCCCCCCCRRPARRPRWPVAPRPPRHRRPSRQRRRRRRRRTSAWTSPPLLPPGGSSEKRAGRLPTEDGLRLTKQRRRAAEICAWLPAHTDGGRDMNDARPRRGHSDGAHVRQTAARECARQHDALISIRTTPASAVSPLTPSPPLPPPPHPLLVSSTDTGGKRPCASTLLIPVGAQCWSPTPAQVALPPPSHTYPRPPSLTRPYRDPALTTPAPSLPWTTSTPPNAANQPLTSSESCLALHAHTQPQQHTIIHRLAPIQRSYPRLQNDQTVHFRLYSRHDSTHSAAQPHNTYRTE